MVKDNKLNANKIKASPTKRFFVQMLTRDIELHDSILDLLDNCIDGLLRHKRGVFDEEVPYKGFGAKITFDRSSFEIKDNCGGIPLEIAQNYAFMMGRPKDEDDSDIATVGMYGIGMKRAMFKIGNSSCVSTRHDGFSYEVRIPPKWLEEDDNWELEFTAVEDTIEGGGTIVRIEGVRESVSRLFTETHFKQSLNAMIASHYGFIINKGFTIEVNGEVISGRNYDVLWSDLSDEDKQGVEPYMYQANIEGVDVSLVVGFNSPMLNDEELDEEQKSKRSKEDAGWTIICNDRVVVFNDKTRLTGWGEANVPSYHTQFIGISGIVRFDCNDAWKLPVTTTKRGVDTDSELYLYVKDFMREGLKLFTSYTNKWKSNKEEGKRIISSAKRTNVASVFEKPTAKEWSGVRRSSGFKVEGERKYIPILASPRDSDPYRQVRYSARVSDLRLLAEYLFDDPDVPPSEVGEESFRLILEKAQGK